MCKRRMNVAIFTSTTPRAYKPVTDRNAHFTDLQKHSDGQKFTLREYLLAICGGIIPLEFIYI